MSTDGKDFQKNRLPWSRWKHAILIQYLKTMAAVLQSRGTTYVVDGFAGPGRYVEDGEDGSPLLAAKHAKSLYDENANYELRCINVESESEVFENLERATEPYKPLVENFHGSFGEYVRKILALIGTQPTLFFLDPIGVKGLEWDALLPIFSRYGLNGITELLIRFDARSAIRLTGSDITFHPTFNAILGETNSRYWQEYLENCGSSGQERRDCITDAYEDKIKTQFDYVARIPIKRSDDFIQYYLIYTTRNLKGIQVMNDVLAGVNDLRDRTLDAERISRDELVQLDMFATPSDTQLINELNTLKSIILSYMKKGETYRRDDLRAMIALQGNNFGRFSGTHYTAVLGGKSRKLDVPKTFATLKSQIVVTNEFGRGSDKATLMLVD